MIYTGSMLLERFLGRKPSHFQLNPIVKAYMTSEALLWSAWDFVLPIIAIFIAKNIAGGSIQTAAMSYSIYLISRVIFELISGRLLQKSTNRQKLTMAISGMLCLSIAYVGFAFSQNILSIFLFFSLCGAGLGLAAPAKGSLFSTHLDKNKEATEWSLADATTFICMSLATALGGFIAAQYGFPALFMLSSIITIFATIPYFLLLK